ncbi:Hin recombinase [Escherichia coli]|nr:Hin recombinase [Escherichia coli]
MARARDAGKRFGRPPILNEEQKQKVLERIKSGASISAIAREFRTTRQTILRVREGANKQVISSQVDSLIKISRIWANFFPANTSNQPI